MAVRGRARHRLGADLTGGRWPVIHDHGLAERLLEVGRNQPAHHVVRAAGGKRHDQADGLGRPGLRRGGTGSGSASATAHAMARLLRRKPRLSASTFSCRLCPLAASLGGDPGDESAAGPPNVAG